jgi:hypothetical protein
MDLNIIAESITNTNVGFVNLLKGVQQAVNGWKG